MSKTCIHCETKEESALVLDVLASKDHYWINGDKVNKYEECWEAFRESTCYAIDDTTGKVSICHIGDIDGENYKLITANDYLYIRIISRGELLTFKDKPFEVIMISRTPTTIDWVNVTILRDKRTCCNIMPIGLETVVKMSDIEVIKDMEISLKITIETD